MKKELTNREDIELLVKIFYEKLLADPELGPVFTEVAQINLTDHLPHLYDFWESVLFQTAQYKRNAMIVHLELHRKHALEQHHFERWLGFFNQTVDELFHGDLAAGAKHRARSIASIIQLKIDTLEKNL